MSLVVDASVAIKWFMIEDQREEALAVLDLEIPLVAPDLFKAEFTNVLWKKIKRSEIKVEDAKMLIARVESFLRFVPTSMTTETLALDFAVRLDHPTYDCTYLALAQDLGTKLVTADRRFANKLFENRLGHLVMRLSDIHPAAVRPVLSDRDLSRLIELFKRYDAAIKNIGEQLRPSTKTFVFVDTKSFQPAFDSPAYQKLQEILSQMSRDELADLVALGWLGQGYNGNDFAALRRQALEYYTESTPTDFSYVNSILHYVEQGIRSLTQNETGRS